MDEWSNQIEALKGQGCHWRSGSQEDAVSIMDLAKEIACDPELDPHQQAWLLECMKRALGAPKGVVGDLMKDAAAQAFPPPPIPEGCIKATAQPIDLQIAQFIYDQNNSLISERAWSLFRYADDKGFWSVWTDTSAKKAAQDAAQLFASEAKEGWCFPFGSATHVKGAVEQLKVMTTDGPLASDLAPPVIVFRNGTFNLTNRQLEPHNPKNGATYGVAADYIEKAECPQELERVISTCYPPGARAIIQAIIRWTIDPTVRYGEAFHIIGPSGSGKGLLIDFLRSLLSPNVVGQLRHPADLSGPEKLHQYVVGRRLVAFPDTPSTLNNRDGDSCNLFYELVENKPVTTRKLFAGESEVSRPMNCRFILGSVRPLYFKDGRDGYLRRVIVLHTVPRDGTTDTTLRDALNGDGPRHDIIRAEAISWALAMSMDDVNNVLNREDSDGLLWEVAAEAAIHSDSISQWADQCLTSTDDHPDMPVGELAWDEMYACYLGWCRHEHISSRHVYRRTNFQGQVRAILGPKRCIERKRASKEEAILYGVSEREQLPRLDLGFALRSGLMSKPSIVDSTWPSPECFNPSKMSSGGLEEISKLPQGKRTPTIALGQADNIGQ